MINSHQEGGRNAEKYKNGEMLVPSHLMKFIMSHYEKFPQNTFLKMGCHRIILIVDKSVSGNVARALISIVLLTSYFLSQPLSYMGSKVLHMMTSQFLFCMGIRILESYFLL